ncbi:MAG: tRNA pseudouridine(38-40) synthase TruA [Candidatus Rokubacteria bacterium]|nr:tRNA pseudouridine(38-40) synthase TruA [Candidatus Rokubacteria bacterium]
MRWTWRLTVSYDGTAYAGWQVQRGGPPTVQGLLAEAARRLCGPTARVTGASRTDAGVHALGQVVSLVTDTVHGAEAVRGALNAALPPDVRVMRVEPAPPGFDARRAAVAKRYLYLIDNARVASPLLHRFAWHVPAPLDVAAMRAALASLRGRHDFSAFRASAGRDKAPVCEVRAAHVVRRRDRVALLVSADRFLHHMVRVIVGSAVEVGRGAREPAWVGQVLASRDRRIAGPTAPAHGLVLLCVVYG